MSIGPLKGIRIVTDGSIFGGTKVYDAEGVEMTNLVIQKVEFRHKAGEIPTAQLTCLCAEIDAVVPEAEVTNAGTD